MRVLITGGGGFIGSNLCIALLKKGYRVTILDNLSTQIHGSDIEYPTSLLSVKEQINFIKGDVCDSVTVGNAIADNEIIVHLAAETGTGQSMYQIKKYLDVNVSGTATILDYLTNNKTKVNKLIIASSRAIYGEGKYFSEKYGFVYPTSRNVIDLQNGNFDVTYIDDKDLKLCPTDENAKLHPTSVYGISKLTQEQICLTVGAALGISVIAFRYQNVYGPGQSLKNPYTGILSIFSTQIRNNLPINIFEDGKESRDFVYIDDVINATLLGIENKSIKSEVFNVGSGEAISVIDTAEALINQYDYKLKLIISGNFRIGDIRHNFADLSKIRSSSLGFIPKISFQDGIIRFTNWVKTQPHAKSYFDKSMIELKEKGLTN